jgi:polyisoprenoid-binding protein YceI
MRPDSIFRVFWYSGASNAYQLMIYRGQNMSLSTFCKTLVLTLLASQTALAQWNLDNDMSSLSFVTTKAEHVAEVHTFEQMSGTLTDSGALSIAVELISVNTMIPIRNERMQAMLFETDIFPEAAITAQIDMAQLSGMAPGDTKAMAIDFELSIKGVAKTYTADIQVTRTGAGLVASTRKPIVVSAESHDLVSGVEALREVAGLPSISRAVPVSFSVVFN